MVALLEDIFCYMRSLLFCILYCRLLIIRNDDRELTLGRPGLDGRIILNGSSDLEWEGVDWIFLV